jgi:hypothetical protein
MRTARRICPLKPVVKTVILQEHKDGSSQEKDVQKENPGQEKGSG